MNNLSKTIMTIAVAGSLLFGTVATSSAELAKTIGTERAQINGLGNLLDGPHGGDGDPDPLTCQATGKITKLMISGTDHASIRIFSAIENKTYHFDMAPSNPSRQWDLLKLAQLHNLELTLFNGTSPCEGITANVGHNVTFLWIESGLTK